MRAVISVIGKDTIGILSKVSTICSEHSANVIDVTQTVMQNLFAMVMLVDIQKLDTSFGDFADDLKSLGEKQGLSVHVMHEDIFNSMHRI